MRMKPAIERLGVPGSALLLEEGSSNTRGNAINTGKVACQHRIRRILLVTSSIHMPRAVSLFQRTGLVITPVPVPEIARRAQWGDRWLPSPYALWRSGRALKEYVALMALSAAIPDAACINVNSLRRRRQKNARKRSVC
jgi:uncharacterized SAM-binding protein YcdF (DUF218 family)